MNKVRIAPAENGSQKRRTCLVGCLAAVGICVIVSAAGAWAIYRAVNGDAALPAGITYQAAARIGEEFVDGLMDGSIRPETGIRIASQLFIDVSDGVLTKEEIGSILEQMRRARDMNL